MTTPFTRGLIKTLVYYGIGFTLVYLSYLIFGHEYIHGPGVHHLIGFLVLLGGAGWVFYRFLQIIYNNHDRTNLASLITNIIILSSIILFVVIDINKNAGDESTTNKEDIITIYKNSASNSASVIGGFGDTYC